MNTMFLGPTITMLWGTADTLATCATKRIGRSTTTFVAQMSSQFLVAFIGRDDLPVLVHGAIAHAQFETIHPFADGNGRTGRALVHSMLRARGLTRNVTVPVSAGSYRIKMS